MDNVRELTALLVAKNKLLEKIRNGDYDLEKSDIKEHISKCKEILPEDLSDKLSSTVDNLVDLYETMFEATDLDEADVEKASKLHEELGKLHEDVIYDIYASDLKLAYLSGELNEKDINDLKSNDYLTDDEKSIITKTIKELEDVREVENNNMENAEQQSMKDNEKGNENKSASLTDFYNDLKLFNTFFQQFKNNLSNGTFTLDELNLNVKEFETFEEFYDSKLKNWNIPINQMTNDMMSMFNNI